MHVVIEISSYDKEWITNGYYIPEEINIRISEAIANGTILPKGHGRLIDADNVKSHFSDKEGDAFTAFHFYDAVENAPTIIEASKESEEK